MAASDHLHPGQIPPERREQILDAIRQASHVMGEHPESFSLHEFDPENQTASLIRKEAHGGVSHHFFHLHKEKPQYALMSENWAGWEEMPESEGKNMSPAAFPLLGRSIPLRRGGVWHEGDD